MPKRILLLLSVSILLFGCNIPWRENDLPTGTSPNQNGQPATVDSTADQQELDSAVTALLVETNKARLKVGQPPLVANSSLVQVAQSRAEDMAKEGYLDHVHPLRGTAEIERLLRSEFPDSRIAELLFFGDCSLDELADLAVSAWLGDEANRVVLTGAGYELMGVGIEGSPDGYYAVLVITEDN